MKKLKVVLDEGAKITLEQAIGTQDDKETAFCTEIPYAEIVCRLFLWHTHHSGGTSTGMKMK